MKVEVLVPQEFMGDVIGNLNGRRGKDPGNEGTRGMRRSIDAAVPLAKCSDMPPILRSRTQGTSHL